MCIEKVREREGREKKTSEDVDGEERKERKNHQLIPPAGESRRGAVGVCAGGKILLAVGGLSAIGMPGVSYARCSYIQITVNGLIVSASTSQANLERRSRTEKIGLSLIDRIRNTVYLSCSCFSYSGV